MSKPAQTRKLAENHVQAVRKNALGSAQKARLVLDLIRNKPVEKALSELTFCRKRIAAEVKKTLQSAIANAENNHQLNVDKLIVKEVFIGKGMVLKRFTARARGRGARIEKPRCHITVVVAEQEMAKKAPPAKSSKPQPQATA